MSATASLATAARVLVQLRHDRRTIAIVVVLPCLLLALLHEMFAGRPEAFQRVGGPLVGIFPFTTMFAVTSVTMLRERTTGTLERLMTLPLAKVDLLVGYAAAFAVLAAFQAAAVSALAFGALGLDTTGSPFAVGAVAVLDAILGSALGLFVSAFARTEFQAVQFLPAFVIPQLLLCGLFVPRPAMATGLRALSDVLPLTYAFDVLQRITRDGALGSTGARNLAVIAAFLLASVALGAATLRRRTD